MRLLFKKNSKGQLQRWVIEVEGDKHRTIEGLQDGKQTTSEWTVAKPKNVGNAKETTAEEQAKKEALAKWQKKIDAGWRASQEEAINLVESKPMLAHKYTGKEDVVDRYSQPKLDGVRCKAYRDRLETRTGKPIVATPHILEEIQALFLYLPNDVEFVDGEIYNHDLKDDFNEIISIVKKQKPTMEDYEKSAKIAQFHIYDLAMKQNCHLTDEKFSERWGRIHNTLAFYQGNVLKEVRTTLVHGEEGLNDLYGEYLEQGYEGQMIRTNTKYEGKRTKALLKRKEFVDEEFEIIDVIEGDGNRSGMMGRMHLKKKDGKTFFSNARGSHDYFRELLANRDSLIGKMATIRYQNLTPDGIPRFPVMVAVRDYE